MAVYPSVCATRVNPRRTYDLDTALWVACGLDGPHGFVDAIMTCLDYLVWIVLVPPMISLRPSAGYCKFEPDSPRFGVILGKFDLVLSHDVGISIEDYETG